MGQEGFWVGGRCRQSWAQRMKGMTQGSAEKSKELTQPSWRSRGHHIPREGAEWPVGRAQAV